MFAENKTISSVQDCDAKESGASTFAFGLILLGKV